MSKFLHQIAAYLSLMRLDRPIGIFLLLWPTLIALWLASDGIPDYRTTIIFVMGVVVMRSAGCVINDYADRNIDPFVARTKRRVLATGAVSVHSARLLFVLLMAVAFMLVARLSNFTVYLSLVAAILVTIYPYAKRFTHFPQVVLALAFSWCIPMVYAEVQGKLILETWILYASNMAWVIAYDTEYGMADIVDDLKLGVKSTAITFGRHDKLIIFFLQACSLLGFACIGYLRGFTWIYYCGLGLAFMTVLYQQWLIKQRVVEKCMRAFKNNNWFGMLVFLSVLSVYA